MYPIVISGDSILGAKVSGFFRLGKQNLVISFTIVRVYYLTTVERKEFLPGSPLSHLDYGSRNNDLSLVSGMCIVAITISMALLPCAVSSTWTCGMIQDHHLPALQDFESLGTSICGICYDIAKQY